jgi:integrase
MNRGHLRKRGSSWRIQAYAGTDKAGKRHFISKTVKGTQKDARRALTALLAEADKGLVSTDRSTLAEFLERWLREYARSKVAATTYKRYEELVRIHIVPRIGSIRMGKLDAHHLQNVYEAVEATNCARTALKVHRLMFQVLKYAMRWRVVQSNVAALVDPPKATAHVPFVPAAGDIQRVLAVSQNTRIQALVHLAMMTGLRQGELLGLQWHDVDFENRILYVQRSAQWLPREGTSFKPPKTRRSARAVPLTNDTIMKLRGHRIDQAEARLKRGRRWKDQDLVFSGGHGEPLTPSQVGYAWQKIRAAAGVPRMRFHDLRHAHATLLLTMGVHPKIVSDRLGHSGIAITMDTYSHVMAGLQAEAISGLDRLVAG